MQEHGVSKQDFITCFPSMLGNHRLTVSVLPSLKWCLCSCSVMAIVLPVCPIYILPQKHGIQSILDYCRPKGSLAERIRSLIFWKGWVTILTFFHLHNWSLSHKRGWCLNPYMVWDQGTWKTTSIIISLHVHFGLLGRHIAGPYQWQPHSCWTLFPLRSARFYLKSILGDK